MGTLLAGAAKANITPPVGTYMAGYAGRDHGSVGIHDELWSRVLYLSDGDCEIAIVANDLIGLGTDAVNTIRKLALEQSGVSNVFVANSHTHSGPITSYGTPSEKANLTYMELIFQKMSGAIFEAKHTARTARIGWARTDVQIGVNRREATTNGKIVLGVNPEGPVAPFVDVLRVDEKDTGKPIATLFCHACHPVVMGPDNYYISADYPFYAQDFLGVNTDSIAMFVNGCCGNINAHPRGTFEIAKMLGVRLGSAALKAYTEISELSSDVTLSYVKEHFQLPVEEPPSLEECRKQVEERKAALEYAKELKDHESRRWAVPNAQWFLSIAEQRLSAVESGQRDLALPIEIDAIRINDIGLVSLPGEIFVEIGLEISKRSPLKTTIVVSNSNGSIGYVPTEEEFSKGGYEVEYAIARYKGLRMLPDTDKKLIENALKTISGTLKV